MVQEFHSLSSEEMKLKYIDVMEVLSDWASPALFPKSNMAWAKGTGPQILRHSLFPIKGLEELHSRESWANRPMTLGTRPPSALDMQSFRL